MAIEKIETSAAPKAIGPYSQGVRAGDYIFFSGQIPLDPESGEVVGEDISTQTERVMANMEAVLAAADLDFDRVVKTTIYLVDLGEFSTVNEIYGRHFGKIPPARATVQVAALPKGVKVEIEWVAYIG
ncbi:RidA family protein [Desulfuromonas sp. TF]|jgi:2-iminobutanoate/2-iminopropanoate deaminase|uniref:RidA family protein n=1 Tax=Desulfuromonas sp. TF TaxID=1232410 RepID=UPI000410386F|nr:RidA family protein [Desulfuromonas sp. TF]